MVFVNPEIGKVPVSYLDDIFNSYKQGATSVGVAMTRAQWLDGEHGWRIPMRHIGQLAKRIDALAAQTSTAVARPAWQEAITAIYPWMQEYILAAPLLRNTEARAEHSDDAFRQFMRDLATLAVL